MVPRLTYSIESWLGAPQYSLNRVMVLQKKIIRAIYNLPYSFHTENNFVSNKIFKIHEHSSSLFGGNMFNLVSKAIFSFSSDYHNYGTKNHKNLKIPKFNREKLSHAGFIKV